MGCGGGFEFFWMGALRWDSGDARFCIENRFTLFARFCRLQIGRAEHGDNPARSVFGKPKHAQDKSCGLTAVIQSRIGRGTMCGRSGYCFTANNRDFAVFLLETILHSSRTPSAAAFLCHSEEPATKNLCTSLCGRSYSRRIHGDDQTDHPSDPLFSDIRRDLS